MSIGSLKKDARSKAASKEADDFIAGAKVDGSKAEKPSKRERIYKRVTFSLSDDIDQEIDRLSLIPREFRASRSDVIRAAVAMLASQSDEEIAKRMQEASQNK